MEGETMIELDDETIEITKKIKDLLKGYTFAITRIELFDTRYDTVQGLNIEIRKEKLK